MPFKFDESPSYILLSYHITIIEFPLYTNDVWMNIKQFTYKNGFSNYYHKVESLWNRLQRHKPSCLISK